MCIKIKNNVEEIEFDKNKSLKDQISKNSQIVINYQPEDKDIPYFLQEVEKLIKAGDGSDLHIKVLRGNGSKRRTLKGDITIEELMQSLNRIHEKVDKKLKEMAKYCNKEYDVK